MDSEVHTVILSVQIQRVNFSVRFPCSLVFLLKEGILLFIQKTRRSNLDPRMSF